jgi:hypothetical protein
MNRFLINLSGGVLLSGLAAAQSVYEIDLRDRANYLSSDRPVERGRVVLFHRYPDGALLSIQKDEVARVARVPAAATNRALMPGEAIDVGPTANFERPEAASPEQSGPDLPPAYAGGGGYGAPKSGGAPALPNIGVPYSLPPGASISSNAATGYAPMGAPRGHR